MVPYYITIALTALFAALAQSARTREAGSNGLLRKKASGVTKTLLLLSLLPLIFTAGFRYCVGSDFGAYYKAFSVYNGNPWSALIHFDEPGIIFLTRFVSLFSNDGAAYIFTFSFVTILFTGIAYYNNTDSYLFVILLYIFSGLWNGCFNGVRQYLAATILLYSYKYILEKKFIKFVLTVYFASLFHVSAISMLVLYFIMRSKLNLKNILILVIGIILLSNNYDTIFNFIGLLKDKEIVMNEYATSAVSIFRVLVNCAPALLIIVLYWNKNPDKKQTFYINGLIINAAAILAAANSTYLSRIGIYTGLFVPIGLAELVRIKNPQMQFVVRACILILYAIFWYIDVSGASALNHFQWVWNR